MNNVKVDISPHEEALEPRRSFLWEALAHLSMTYDFSYISSSNDYSMAAMCVFNGSIDYNQFMRLTAGRRTTFIFWPSSTIYLLGLPQWDSEILDFTIGALLKSFS